jgi:hypothetical protein
MMTNQLAAHQWSIPLLLQKDIQHTLAAIAYDKLSRGCPTDKLNQRNFLHNTVCGKPNDPNFVCLAEQFCTGHGTFKKFFTAEGHLASDVSNEDNEDDYRLVLKDVFTMDKSKKYDNNKVIVPGAIKS